MRRGSGVNNNAPSRCKNTEHGANHTALIGGEYGYRIIPPFSGRPLRARLHSQPQPRSRAADVRTAGYAKRRGWEIAGEYIDRGVSGSKDSRPALNRMMADACARKFDAVVVWKLDRFGRSLRHLVNALAELEALGVAFVSLRDNLDLSTPAGRMLFHVVGAMAEFERTLIQERVRAGLRNARSKGKRLGRPKIIVDGSRIAYLRAQGLGWKAVAREMKLGVGTVLRAQLAIRRFLDNDENRWDEFCMTLSVTTIYENRWPPAATEGIPASHNKPFVQ